MAFVIFGSLSHSSIAQTQPDDQSDEETVLLVPFSKFNFFAPSKMLRELRGEGTLNTDSLCAKYFSDFFKVLEESDCAYHFETLSSDINTWTNSVRQETVAGSQRINLAESPELKNLEWEADFVLFVTQYEVEGRIEDNQPAHVIHFDLLNRDLKRITSGEVVGKLFQSKIRDKQERTRVLLQSLADRLCKKLDGKI